MTHTCNQSSRSPQLPAATWPQYNPLGQNSNRQNYIHKSVYFCHWQAEVFISMRDNIKETFPAEIDLFVQEWNPFCNKKNSIIQKASGNHLDSYNQLLSHAFQRKILHLVPPDKLQTPLSNPNSCVTVIFQQQLTSHKNAKPDFSSLLQTHKDLII